LRQQAIGVIDELVDSARETCRDVYTFSDITFETVLLFFSEDEDYGEQADKLIRRISGQLRDYNSHNNFVRLSCAASELLPGSPHALPQVYEQVKTAIKGRIEKREGNVLRFDRENDIALQKCHPFAQNDALRDAVSNQDIDSAERLIRADWSRLSMPRPGTGYLLMEEQLRCLNGALRLLPGVEKLPSVLRISVKDALSGGAASDEIPNRLCEKLRSTLQEYRDFFVTSENSMILQAKQYVAQHFAEDITLNDIAKHVCLSPAYFSTLFKNETGIGFVKYLQHVRVEHAKKLLKTSKMRISDIAQSVGYRDLKFFNKIFFSETNVTPSEFRKFYS
jgi:two-component system response regulator YesN